jgi:pimeloyl-ACP methyl ester carboxylesterase
MKRLFVRTAGFTLNLLALVLPRKAARLGFNLFCFPFRSRLTVKQKAFLATGQQGHLSFDGLSIQTYRWGSGPKKVLLLHGWQSHSYRWKKLIESLDHEAYTIHALDAPGHGLSTGRLLHVPLYSEVISRFMERIGPVDSVIGHSLGGFSALYTFRHRPHLRVNKVVALASPGGAREFFSFYQQSLSLTQRSIGLVEAYFVELLKHSPEYYSAPAFAAALDIPGLIIHDEDDSETSIDNGHRIHRAWKDSRFIRTRGLGHNLRSEQVVNDVISFIKNGLHSPVPVAR